MTANRQRAKPRAKHTLVRDLIGDYKDKGGTRPREYEVAGPLRVFETRPGQRFTRAIPEAQEARLIARGSIRRIENRDDQNVTGDPVRVTVSPDPPAET